jgi:hypothetical protein
VTETSRATLRRAEEAIDKINAVTTWKSAVAVIKRVMDTVTPIAAVWPVSFLSINPELIAVLQLNPYASLAWSLLSKIPEVHLLVLSQNGALTLLSSLLLGFATTSST